MPAAFKTGCADHELSVLLNCCRDTTPCVLQRQSQWRTETLGDEPYPYTHILTDHWQRDIPKIRTPTRI